MSIPNDKKNEVAKENFNLIHYVARRFHNTGLSYDELVSIGSVGYTKALNTYDSNKGAKFSTYAVTCIKNEILHFLRQEKKHTINTVLSGTLLYIDKEGNELSIEDILSNEMNNEPPTENIALLKEDIKILIEAIKELPKREQFIILNRFGICGGGVYTQEAIGEKLGMSQANVSKLEHSILEKLSKKLNGKINIEQHDFYYDVNTPIL